MLSANKNMGTKSNSGKTVRYVTFRLFIKSVRLYCIKIRATIWVEGHVISDIKMFIKN